MSDLDPAVLDALRQPTKDRFVGTTDPTVTEAPARYFFVDRMSPWSDRRRILLDPNVMQTRLDSSRSVRLNKTPKYIWSRGNLIPVVGDFEVHREKKFDGAGKRIYARHPHDIQLPFNNAWRWEGEFIAPLNVGSAGELTDFGFSIVVACRESLGIEGRHSYTFRLDVMPIGVMSMVGTPEWNSTSALASFGSWTVSTQPECKSYWLLDSSKTDMLNGDLRHDVQIMAGGLNGRMPLRDVFARVTFVASSSYLEIETDRFLQPNYFPVPPYEPI